MQSQSDLRHVVTGYLDLIRLDSAETADAIEALFALCGADAALRASLVLSLIKMEIQAHYALETLTIQRNLIDRYPEALPLLERALSCYMRDWGMPQLERLSSANDLLANADEEFSTLGLPTFRPPGG